MFQPDYTGKGYAVKSPNLLYGGGAYVDAKFNRWLVIEAEGRWLRLHQYQGIEEDSYLIGPRVPIATFHGVTPYGKFLFGMGNGGFLTGTTLALVGGGGIDYRLSRRFTLRAFDFEYQQWHAGPMLYPYGGSIGISYKLF